MLSKQETLQVSDMSATPAVDIPAAAPALSHGLGGETDAMDMREGFGTSAISHGDGPHRGGQSKRERERETVGIARKKD
ncbi:pantothenate transporter [Aspergillus luchuensis]|uniref:Pantothenate transporter n=1 Tax=Aspergillus kawachii TaxID=1069201 RepID=A0A146FVG8_ASPKA|nr:pantothenate transporter [Aspergillus luchuensis]